MLPKVALLGYIIFITWLFLTERKRPPQPSLSLWVPTVWLMIMMSRPIGAWFIANTGSVMQGSVYDRYVLTTLTLLAILILSKRNFHWPLLLKNNAWLVILYTYLGTSILWSDFPYNSFKRWVKLTECIVIACVILSEKSPFQALERVLRRSAYVLVPLSVVLIKYFPAYGRTYSSYEGVAMGTGVTTQKNSLGALCAISAFFFIWSGFSRWKSGEFSQKKEFIPDLFVTGIAIFLLFGGGGTYSATSISIFFIGIACLILLFYMKKLRQLLSVHLKGVVIVGVGLFMFFHSLMLPMILPVLHRSENLTDRDKIWTAVLKEASRRPIIGTGYGGFWGLEADSKDIGVNQAHNGYLDVYLQVGILGIAFLSAFLLEFCGKVKRELNYLFEWGVFGTCFLIMTLFYNYTEGSFLRANNLWTIMVFLTVVFSAPSFNADAVKEIESEQSFRGQNA